MITISHNEIVVACRKAFEALGFSPGQAEDGADSIGWLLVHGLSMPDDFLTRLNKLQPATELPVQLSVSVGGGSVWDAQGASGLSCFPNLADFASVQAGTAGSYQLIIQNMADVDLIWPYLICLQKRGCHVLIQWAEPNQYHRVVIFSGQTEPDCYLLKNSTAIMKQEGDVRLIVSFEPLVDDEILNRQKIRIDTNPDLQSNYLDRIQNGIDIDKDVWDQLNLIGKKLLVESTAESELRGAGGV